MMRRTVHTAAGLLMIVGLAGCAGASRDPATASPVGPAAFTLPVPDGNLAAASNQAALNCRAQGRTAQLLSRSETSAYYRCM